MKIRDNWLIKQNDVLASFYSRDETIDSVKTNFDIRRYHSAEGFTVVVDDTEEQVLIQEHTNPYNSDNIDKKIHLRNEALINRGSKVFWTINETDRLFIVTGKSQSNLAYQSTKMVECNFKLKWIDSDDGLVCEEDCVVGTFTLYSDGVVVGKDVNLGNNQIKILIPQTEKTRKFTRDQRFVISKNVFKITSFQDYVTPGIIVLVLAETEMSEYDNFELGIADYNLLLNYKIKIINSNLTMSLSNVLQLNVIFEKNGVPVFDQPTFEYKSSDQGIATIDSNGLITPWSEGITEITATYGDYNDTVILSVTNIILNNFTINISGSSSIKLNQNLFYSAEIFNNGILQENEPVTWTIRNQDDTDILYGLIQSQTDKSCIIKCGSNSAYISKQIFLKAELNSDNSIYKEVLIRINNII